MDKRNIVYKPTGPENQKPLSVVLFDNRFSQGTQSAFSWDEFIEQFKAPTAQGKEGPMFFTGQVEDNPVYFTEFDIDNKTGSGIVSHSFIVFDIDSSSISVRDLADKLKKRLPCDFLIHSTYQHTPENPKYRIYIPLKEPIADPAIWEKLTDRVFTSFVFVYGALIDEISFFWNIRWFTPRAGQDYELYWDSSKGPLDGFLFMAVDFWNTAKFLKDFLGLPINI